MKHEGRRVLVAEDEATCRSILVRTLEGVGITPLVAETGEAALELFAAEQPSIVITDWVLPGMTGVDLCRALRAQASPGYVYIIVITARAQKGDAVTALTAGADEFLTKPFTVAELRARVATAERILTLEQALRARVDNLEEAMNLLRDSQDKLVEAERLATVGAVSLTVRHEVNNPLTGIIGLTDLYLAEEEGPMPAHLKDGLQHILQLARRISNIVQRLQVVRRVRTKEYLPGSAAGLSLIDLGSDDA